MVSITGKHIRWRLAYALYHCQQTQCTWKEAWRVASDAMWVYRPHLDTTNPVELVKSRLKLWRKN